MERSSIHESSHNASNHSEIQFYVQIYAIQSERLPQKVRGNVSVEFVPVNLIVRLQQALRIRDFGRLCHPSSQIGNRNLCLNRDAERRTCAQDLDVGICLQESDEGIELYAP